MIMELKPAFPLIFILVVYILVYVLIYPFNIQTEFIYFYCAITIYIQLILFKSNRVWLEQYKSGISFVS